MERLTALVGLFAILLLAWACSENRWRMNFRLILSGIGLQFLVALLLLKTRGGEVVFGVFEKVVNRLLGFSDAGAAFVFGESYAEHHFAFSVLPTIIFISALSAVLFHLGVLQWIVKGVARLMAWVMDTSGTESLAAGAEVFVGMTESPLLIRPYLATMTRSELFAMMTVGMGTVAGGTMAAYVRMGVSAGHLMAASLMAAPASLVIAKIMVPETEDSPTKGSARIELPRQDLNLLDAACRGAGEGLRLALNVAAMLIAFIALVACVNWGLAKFTAGWGCGPVSLERLLGWLCAPLAWLIGVRWEDAQAVGALLGKKTVLNELLAYSDLVQLRERLSPRSFTISTYALCGFANFGSVAILIGGVSGLVPDRREVFARYGLRAMFAGGLATMMTAAIAGILL